jgi:hypothetical protein
MYTKYVVKGVAHSRLDRFSQLTETEMLVVQDVVEHNWRLEQEHISQDYVHIRLRQLLSDS